MSTQMAKSLRIIAEGLRMSAEGRAVTLHRYADILESAASPPLSAPWVPPVGNAEYPPESWYCYTLHDVTGRRNRDDYPHTGGDFNLDIRPWGDVDVNQPVFCVTDGIVTDVGFSQRYRGGIVIKVDHFGIPLYIRYWHLKESVSQRYTVGAPVFAGEELGEIDIYPGGAAHCHIDMAWQPFKTNWWFNRHPEIEWANPAYILKTHIDPDLVDAMMARGGD